MHFATPVRIWRVARLYSVLYGEARKPFGTGYMYIYTFLLRMTDIMTSQNMELSSWDTLVYVRKSDIKATGCLSTKLELHYSNYLHIIVYTFFTNIYLYSPMLLNST
jgi:hypothetical protein